MKLENREQTTARGFYFGWYPWAITSATQGGKTILFNCGRFTGLRFSIVCFFFPQSTDNSGLSMARNTFGFFFYYYFLVRNERYEYSPACVRRFECNTNAHNTQYNRPTIPTYIIYFWNVIYTQAQRILYSKNIMKNRRRNQKTGSSSPRQKPPQIVLVYFYKRSSNTPWPPYAIAVRPRTYLCSDDFCFFRSRSQTVMSTVISS